jgi:hypothetical protein
VTQNLADAFARLFLEARKRGGLDYMFTLVRVSGISSEPDPLLGLAEKVGSEGPYSWDWYCSLLREIEEALSLTFNLARCASGEAFDPFPFRDLLPIALRRREMERPSEVALIAESTAASLQKTGFEELAKAIRGALPASVLNKCGDAHVEGDEIPEAFSASSEFFRSLLAAYSEARFAFVDQPTLYRLPGFEVLELLLDESVGLFGFRLHFSTGTSAHFLREESKTDAVNLIPDVPLQFSIGNAEARREEWRIGERRLHEIGLPGRYNPAGEWRPLVFPGDPGPLRAEAVAFSEDPDVQGAYFYMLCTGHRVLEFVVMMKVELPARVMTYGGRIHLAIVNPSTEAALLPGAFIYDGWVDLDDGSPETIASALDALSRVFNRMALALDSAVTWRPKYSFRIRAGGEWHPDEEDLRYLNTLLTSFPEGPDGEAIDVAVDWYNRGQGSGNPFTAFLCFYIAIESIVQAVFDGSANFGLGITRVPAAERERERNACIQEHLERLYATNPEEFIRDAYFNCLVGSTERARRVISAVFGAESRQFERLFVRVEGVSLADLRSQLAHGRASELAPRDAHTIRIRVGEVRYVCREFLLRLLLSLATTEALPPWVAQRSLNISFGDPRNVEVVSSLDGLPSQEWTIQPEWISWD